MLTSTKAFAAVLQVAPCPDVVGVLDHKGFDISITGLVRITSLTTT
jgi:hypothetical protein